jgi:hypothetical protein
MAFEAALLENRLDVRENDRRLGPIALFVATGCRHQDDQEGSNRRLAHPSNHGFGKNPP